MLPAEPSRSAGPDGDAGDANYCSWKQVMLVDVANPEPLTPTEELFWRALMRIVLSLPRQLHDDMVRATGLTASEYTVIMNLSEAPNRQLRMADLASATGLSAEPHHAPGGRPAVTRAGRQTGQFRRRTEQPRRADVPGSDQAAVGLAGPCHERPPSRPRPRPSRHARQGGAGARGGSGPTGGW